mmetsp:Transcript_13560/g.25091  ORF Transcript_13560/g.25091 Transcript_13560/m.25091 type:complete len:208 (-) Transcript_13560:2035-2658(-)
MGGRSVCKYFGAPLEPRPSAMPTSPRSPPLRWLLLTEQVKSTVSKLISVLTNSSPPPSFVFSTMAFSISTAPVRRFSPDLSLKALTTAWDKLTEGSTAGFAGECTNRSSPWSTGSTAGEEAALVPPDPGRDGAEPSADAEVDAEVSVRRLESASLLPIEVLSPTLPSMEPVSEALGLLLPAVAAMSEGFICAKRLPGFPRRAKSKIG